MHCMGRHPPCTENMATMNFFSKVVQDHQRLQHASGTNYCTNSGINENLQQGTIDALVNLASTMADDRNAVANLMSANAMLASQIKIITENSTKQKEEMDSMETNIVDILYLLRDASLNHNCNMRGGRGGHGGRQIHTQQPRTHAVPPRVYYCWPHGISNGEHDTSCNCDNRKPGHQVNATALNCMGRSMQGIE
eukprot:4644831-Ditylum_brightwellii.AAC.1